MTERHPEEMLAPFVDGELTGDEHRAVQAHVASCSVCAEEVGLARRAALALGRLEEVPSPAGLSTPAIQRARPGSRLVARLGWAAAGAAAAAIVAVFAVSQITGPAKDASTPGAADGVRAPAAESTADGTASDLGSGNLPLYTETHADYTQENLRERVLTSARAAEFASYDQTLAKDDSSLDSAAGRAALECIESAGLRADEQARLIQIELARFEGDPAYMVLFWRDEDSLELWVVDQATCQIRFLANA